ncbi:MAG: rhizopine catabolism protein [Thiotrichales bacterium]|nr:rhizopine catabolism protein [Thiotrichales bacterium]
MQDFVGAKEVLSRERLQSLSERSDGPALRHLATHWGTILICGYALLETAGTWWCVPFFILQGILINFLYAPEHECDHNTAFKSRWLNTWVARACGFLTFFPNDYHRWSHYAHHRNTQDWDKDPEILGRDRHDSVSAYLWVLSGIPNIIGRFSLLWNHSLGKVDEWYASEAQKTQMIRCARWFAALYVLIGLHALWIGSWWPLYLWLAPWAVMRWHYWMQGMLEHGGLTHEPLTLINTRTFRTNWFMHWVNWNMSYHTLHHTFPSVPFYRLPALQQEVEAAVGYQLPTTSYLEAHARHLSMLLAGAKEIDICARHEAELTKSGILPLERR